ncbi:PEGA domain-containing protein [Desulfobacterales bacterium HSG16]|nr:PEGA domain-containing protein [Desulfobacterales bacterium HSG16]
MKNRLLTLCIVSILCMAFFTVAFAERGIVRVKIKERESMSAPVAGEVKLYDSSYALIIGIDKYTNGWPRLSDAVSDANLISDALKKKGFQVTLKKNLNSADLENVFEEFFVLKGDNPNARLFVWFAGHGHTIKGEGFLVPSDAPDPEKGARFRLKALSMRRFGEYMRLAQSKHVYAVFDSCFSGTVFSTGRSRPPAAITRATTMPVRQFLTSGDADQEVMDDGRFRKLFIRALQKQEKADANSDGYLTAAELGMFMTDRITNLTMSKQTPRYGKLRDENYDRGDFVFLLASSGSGIDDRTDSDKALLSVESNISGARVLLDGRFAGNTPLSDLEISQGNIRLSVEKSGFETYRKTIRMKKGRSMSMYVDLKEDKPSRGNLYVETDPEGANVRILNIGPSYYQGIELEPGRYHVEVSAKGHEARKQWVSLSAGEDKNLFVRLSKKSGGEKVRVKERDGRFVAYVNGTVLDTRTKLMWAAKDNGEDINWKNAKRYCENYQGGGYTDWRLPTIKELRGLYDENKGYTMKCNTDYTNHLTRLIHLTCCCPWSSETSGSSAAFFYFFDGNVFQFAQSISSYFRVLPVRAGN